jgi:hypothetical protein
MTNEEHKAREILLSIYEERRFNKRVSPTWLATMAMTSLDPLRVSHPIEYAMAHLQFRQLARSICAGRWEKAEGDEEKQIELFSDLQTRYPTAPANRADDEPEYVLLEELTEEDFDFNIARLRSEGMAKIKHSDTLAAYKKVHLPRRAETPLFELT